MGARLIRRWIIMPLKERKPIQERLDVVEFLVNNDELRENLLHELKQIGDLERLISKIGLQKANPREVMQLKRALYAIFNLKELCQSADNYALKTIAEQFNPCLLIRDKI